MEKPFDCTIPPEGDKARYKMHKYWAGKPWYVVANYIRHYTREGEIVLDPFCGKGVVGCEALINKRKAVLRDINPMATFISECLCESPLDLCALQKAFEEIKNRVKNEIMDMYRLETICPVCKGPVYAKHLVRGPAIEGEWIVEARCERRHGLSGHFRRELTPGERVGINLIESAKVPYWYPDDEIPRGRETMRLINAKILTVDQLFTRRNLLALSMIYDEIRKIKDPQIKRQMTLAFSNTLLHTSKLKSEKLRPMSANSYYCMGDWIEENVWQRFENRVMWRWGLMRGKRETNEHIGDYYKKAEDFSQLLTDKTFLIETAPAQRLTGIPDEGADYIFTDPPYGGSIQYQELTMLWRAWLRMPGGFTDDEITVNDFRKKGPGDFETMLTAAFSEAYRVLKPDKWLTVTFNHKDPLVWSALLGSCEKAGFELVNVLPQSPVGNSFVQSWAGNALKSDLLLNFRKCGTGGGLRRKPEPEGQKIESMDLKSIIIESTNKLLSQKGSAALPQIFEAAVIHWLSLMCTNTDANRDPFDMGYVDECLAHEPGFIRTVAGGTAVYEKHRE